MRNVVAVHPNETRDRLSVETPEFDRRSNTYGLCEEFTHLDGYTRIDVDCDEIRDRKPTEVDLVVQ